MATEVSVRIGQRVRHLRVRGSTSAQRLADEARAMGLPWSRTVVTNIETGQRDVSAAELLLLPLILTASTGRHVRLIDLLVARAKDDLPLTKKITFHGAGLRKLLAGEEVAIPGYTPLSIAEAIDLLSTWEASRRKGRG